jgi:uncharacterized protein
MSPPSPSNHARIDLVDALRGTALFGILILHAIEHWDFGASPEGRSAWLLQLDSKVGSTIFFLFAGKSYAVFALTFGISFFITLNRWSERTPHARAKFAWRLSLLGALGYVHGLLFCGDILQVIAVLGLPLVFLDRLSSRALAWIAGVLFLQLPALPDVVRVLSDPAFAPARPYHWELYGKTGEVFSKGSLLDVIKLNATTGQGAKWWWCIETYRYPQMLGLFICGLLVGRRGVLHDTSRLRRLALRAVLAGAVGFALVYVAQRYSARLSLEGARGRVLRDFLNMYGNLAQFGIWAGGFVLLYQCAPRAQAAFRLLVPYGRMSLTGYVTQSLIGIPVYYGFGLAMYRHWGSLYSLLFGLGVFVLQCALAHLWMRKFCQGPLEWLWRAATERTLKLPLRRSSERNRPHPQRSEPVSA